MKKIGILLLTLVLVLSLGAAPALADDDTQTVTVLGSATVTVTPDEASFTVGVTTQDATVAAAQSANATQMQAVLQALKDKGVAEADLQTANYSINPVYDYSSDGNSQTLKGYSVTNTVQVTVHDITLLPTLLDASAVAGANETYGVSFTSTQSSAAYDKALQAAVLDAVRKGDLMATALSRKAGAVLSLTETNDNYLYTGSGKAMMMDSMSATPIQSGSLSVTASITAVIALQ